MQHAAYITATQLVQTPPDGVDLDALNPRNREELKLKSVDECKAMYDKAFDEAGGPEALERNAELAQRWSTAMGDKVVVSQMEVWQCYDLPFMRDRFGDDWKIRRFGIELLGGLFSDMKNENPVEEEDRECGTPKLVIGDIKKLDRSSVKTRIKYGLDCSRLCDLNRATFVFKTIDGMYQALDRLFRRWGPAAGCYSARVVEFEDHYQKEMSGGYRHLQVLVHISGCVWELQLQTYPMIEAKKSAGHKLYKTTRFVREMLLFAAMEGDVEALDKILNIRGVQKVADPNEVSDKNGLTALHHAAFRGEAEIIERLLDPNLVANPSNLWRTDKTSSGGLALNYATHMRHWSVAHILADAMLKEVPLKETPRHHVIESLANTCFAAIDSFSEVPDLLPKLMQLWREVQPVEWERKTPLLYSFQHGNEAAQKTILAGAKLWTVDRANRLPIELAVTYKFWSTAEYLVAPMREQRPVKPSAHAVASLSRCRGTQLPQVEELVGSLKEWQIITTGCDPKPMLREVNMFSLEKTADQQVREPYTCLIVEGSRCYAGGTTGSIDMYSIDDNSFKFEHTFHDHTQYVSALAVGTKQKWPDNQHRVRRLYSCSIDNTVRIFDLFFQRCVHTLKMKSDVATLCFYKSVLYAAADRTIHSWLITKRGETEARREIVTGHVGVIEAVLVLKDRTYSAGVGGDIRVWHQGDYRSPSHTWRKHTKGYRVGSLRSFDNCIFSAANPTASTTSSSREWRTRPLPNGPSEILQYSEEGVLLGQWRDLSFWLVSIDVVMGMLFGAGSNGILTVWHVDTREHLLENQVHDREMMSFAMGEAEDDTESDSETDTLGSTSATMGSTMKPSRTIERTPGYARRTGASRSPRPALRSPRSGSRRGSPRTRNSSSLYTEKEKDEMKKKFALADKNLDERLTLEELARLVQTGSEGISPLLETLFEKMDIDTDGAVSLEEFIDFIFS